jgi:hypothetical protein
MHEAVGLTSGAHAGKAWVLFKDASKGLEYLRSMQELEAGLYWELGAFKYHVLTEFRGVDVTAAMPYDRLAAELGGRGVPSIERAMVQLRFRPVHIPLRAALGKGHLAYLAEGWDMERAEVTPTASHALEERISHVAHGITYMRGGARVDTEGVIAKLGRRYATILGMVNAVEGDPTTVHARGRGESESESESEGEGEGESEGEGEGESAPEVIEHQEERVDVGLLIAWAQVDAVLELLVAAEDGAQSRSARTELVEHWELALPLVEAFAEESDAYTAEKRAALVLLGATLPTAPLREAIAGALRDPRARAFLGVHDANGVSWLHKERFEELAKLIAHRDFIEGHASVALAERQVDDVTRLAAAEGYRTMDIARALAMPESGGALKVAVDPLLKTSS